MGSEQSGEDKRWKRKYYDSLEELERKERSWEALQHSLYDSLGRVALVAYGTDAGLDRRLDRLREAIRARRDDSRIASLVDLVCTTAEKLRDARDPDDDIDPRLFAVRLIDALELPAARRRDARKLQKRIAGGACRLDDAVDAIATLVGAPPPEPERESALRRFFHAPAEQARAGSDATGTETLGRLLAAIVFPPGLQSDARALAARCRNGDPSALDALIDEIASLVERACGTPDAEPAKHTEPARHTEAAESARHMEAAGPARAGSGDRRVDVGGRPEADAGLPATVLREVLLGLLDQLELPPESHERIERLKARICAGVDVEAVAGVLASIAGLVGELRAEMRRERLDMQSFLAGLGERLSELDTTLASSRDAHAASLEGSTELERKVAGEMAGMRGEIDEAGDLDGLRRAVESRLVTISNHVLSHLGDEQERFAAATERIEALEHRLDETRAEAELLRHHIDEAHQRAARDGLTGLLNRGAFDERLADEHARVRRYGGALSLVFLDIDHFKSINDTFGHQAGDRVLQATARTLATAVRASDIVARYGGEEFVVLMPEAILEDALAVGEKLRKSIEHIRFHHHEQHVPITVSCGVAELLADDGTEALVRRADAALYEAKAGGRNRCVAPNAAQPGAADQRAGGPVSIGVSARLPQSDHAPG